MGWGDTEGTGGAAAGGTVSKAAREWGRWDSIGLFAVVVTVLLLPLSIVFAFALALAEKLAGAEEPDGGREDGDFAD